ncbi:MAG: transporter [Pseudomonadota bacterium]
MRGLILGIAAIGLCGGSAAQAADEAPICADRPGKSTPTCTVPAGHFQLETGVADWSLDKAGGERDTSLAIGETLIRYGLTDHSDIQLDATPWKRATSRGPGFHDSASGFGDVTVIYKHRATPGNLPVQLAFYPYVKIPTAKRSLGNRKWEGGLLIPIDYAIPNSPLGINLTPEIDWVADAAGHGQHLAMVQVASLGWQASDKLNFSADIWAQWDWDPAGTTRQAISGEQ